MTHGTSGRRRPDGQGPRTYLGKGEKGPAADLRIERGRLEIVPDIHSLSRIYIEPTSRCGLSCRTCLQTLTLDTFTAARGKTELNLPRLDVNNTTKDVLFSLLQGFENLPFMGNPLSVAARSCRFIHDRSTFIRWDGQVAPCAGLLHTLRTYLYGLERTVSAYALGDIAAGELYDIWNSAAYARFREKVRDFDFSPCHVCGGCSMLEKNEEDCYGNTFPVCGGCLWARGIIQCP